jgi:hypothetical protein
LHGNCCCERHEHRNQQAHDSRRNSRSGLAAPVRNVRRNRTKGVCRMESGETKLCGPCAFASVA